MTLSNALHASHSKINNSNGFSIAYKCTMIFLPRLYAMENPLELLNYEWEAEKVL